MHGARKEITAEAGRDLGVLYLPRRLAQNTTPMRMTQIEPPQPANHLARTRFGRGVEEADNHGV